MHQTMPTTKLILHFFYLSFVIKRDILISKFKMGGLDYLNKKVWHPGSMKNIQKVWE